MTEKPNKSDAEVTSPSVSPGSVEDLFVRALEKKTLGEQRAFLDEACPNEEYRNRVLTLLEAYADSGSFLDVAEVPPSGSSTPIDIDFLNPVDDPRALGALGPYHILDVLGQGGMGIVFRAFDPTLSRVVAIKAMLSSVATNSQARQRFLREARAAAAISHPHVVTVHAVEPCDESSTNCPPYLVMECIVGQSLQQKIDMTGPLSLPEIVRIGRQITEGLHAAHVQGLIHRDVKPSNILLENGVERAKITDFGLARAMDDITVTRTGEVSGSPTYMSPEQAQGKRVDPRSDLFSLGCVIYAMCTGHSPFRAQGVAHAIKRVTQDQPRPIEEQNEAIPGWLCQVVYRLLQKAPEDRLQSANEVLSLLNKQQGVSGELYDLENSEPSLLKSRRVSAASGITASNDSLSDTQDVVDQAAATSTADENCPVDQLERMRDSSNATVGKYLIYVGMFLASLPWWIILAGMLLRNGDALEFGGSSAMLATLVGILAIALGWIVRNLIVPAAVLRSNIHWWVPLLPSLMVAVIGVATHTAMESSDNSVFPIKAVPPEVFPIISIEHPPMEIRKVSINGIGSTSSNPSESKTNIILDQEHLGTRIRIVMIAKDGRQFSQFRYPVEYKHQRIVTSESDWAAGARTLVEVVDDSDEFELRMVEFPNPLLADGLHILEAPYHCLLSPTEAHRIVITCLPTNASKSPDRSEFIRVEKQVTPKDAGDLKLSLSELLSTETQ